jgi:hypothetical protein
MKPGHAIRNLARTRLGDCRKPPTSRPDSHVRGVKYTMRSDIMYKGVDNIQKQIRV